MGLWEYFRWWMRCKSVFLGIRTRWWKWWNVQWPRVRSATFTSLTDFTNRWTYDTAWKSIYNLSKIRWQYYYPQHTGWTIEKTILKMRSYWTFDELMRTKTRMRTASVLSNVSYCWRVLTYFFSQWLLIWKRLKSQIST